MRVSGSGDPDATQLAALRDAGDDPRIIREVELTFILPGIDELHQIAALLQAEGYRIMAGDPEADGGEVFLTAFTRMPTTELAIADLRRTMDRIAAHAGATFDGWGTHAHFAVNRG